MTQEQLKELLSDGALLRISADCWKLFWNSNASTSSPHNIVVNDFDLSNPSLRCSFQFSHKLGVRELQEQLTIFLADRSLTPLTLEGPDEALFASQFTQIKDEIRLGKLNKAVPVVFAELEHSFSEAELAFCILQLTQIDSAGTPFGVWNRQEGLLGLTPEILFDIEGSLLRTMALAGTLPKETGRSPATLLEDPKEMEEHLYVVQDLESRLQFFGEVHRGPTEVTKLPTLYHLKTPMEVTLKKSFDPYEIIRSLHPTPALGGFPKDQALSLLKRIEITPRHFFAAPVTFYMEARILSLIAIRSLTWTRTRLQVGSGCGIVGRSEFFKEWNELQKKRQATYKNFGNFLQERPFR